MSASTTGRLRGAFTLLELLVVLAILGIALAASAVALRTPASTERPLDARSRIAGARRQAVATGSRVTIRIEGRSGPFEALALPDGRVVTDAPGIDELTGRGIDAAP